MKNKYSKSNKNITKKPIYIIALMILLCLILMPRSGVKGETEAENNNTNETELPKAKEPEESNAGETELPETSETEESNAGETETVPEEENNVSIPKDDKDAAEIPSGTESENDSKQKNRTPRIASVTNVQGTSYNYKIILRYPNNNPAPNQKVTVSHMGVTTIVEGTAQPAVYKPAVTKLRTEILTSDVNGAITIYDNTPVPLSFERDKNSYAIEVSKFPLISNISLPKSYVGISTTNGVDAFTQDSASYSLLNGVFGTTNKYYLEDDKVMLDQNNIYNNNITSNDGSMEFKNRVFPNGIVSSKNMTLSDGSIWRSADDIPYPFPGTNKIPNQRIMKLPTTIVNYNGASIQAFPYLQLGAQRAPTTITSGEINLFYRKIIQPDLINTLTRSKSVVENNEENDWTLKIKHGTEDFPLKNITLKEVMPPGMSRIPGTTQVNGIPVDDGIWYGQSVGDLLFGEEIVITFKTEATGKVGNQKKLEINIDVGDGLLYYNVNNKITIKDVDHTVIGDAPEDDLSMTVVPKGFYFNDINFSSIANTSAKLDLSNYLDSSKTDGLKLRINDNRDINTGWRLNAKMKPLESTTSPGLYLNNASLYLKAKIGELVAPDLHNETINLSPSALRAPTGSADINLPSNDTTINILNAASGKGDGSWLNIYALNDIRLLVPAGQGIAGMQYQSTVTWTLEDAP